MPNLKPIEIILILAVILLLFGAKRLPDAARGLGRSLRIFKSEVKAAQDDEGNSPPQQIKAGTDEVISPTPTIVPPVAQQHTPSQPTTPDAGSTDR